jgi:hypothetical protein
MRINEQSYLAVCELIDRYGVRGAASAFISALKEYADEMSDLGLKEKAIEASEVVEQLSNGCS